MAIDLPPSTVRTTTLKHGNALVDAGLVTQAQLDSVLRNPTISKEERKEAAGIVKALYARIESTPAAFSAGTLKKLEAFGAAVVTEASRADLVDAARGLLERGEITERQFKGITSSPRTIRSTVELALARKSTAREVTRLRALHEHAGPDTKVTEQLTAAATKVRDLDRVIPTPLDAFDLTLLFYLAGAVTTGAVGANLIIADHTLAAAVQDVSNLALEPIVASVGAVLAWQGLFSRGTKE